MLLSMWMVIALGRQLVTLLTINSLTVQPLFIRCPFSNSKIISLIKISARLCLMAAMIVDSGSEARLLSLGKSDTETLVSRNEGTIKQ